MNITCNRRDFLKTATIGVTAMSFSARSYARIMGANERIRIGQIGCGGRGRLAHMVGIHKHDKIENAEYVAVSDPWRIVREQAAEQCKEWYGTNVKQFVSYRDVLACKDVDAVMIASPDHHHSIQLEAAAKAGKHIYVEKPMARNMKELLRAVDAVKEAGVVVQVGTQVRSLPTSTGCNELWKSGLLGKASRIEQCRNSEKPYWYRYVKQEVKKEDLDWDEFTMGITKRPFDPVLYSGWYGYLEFNDGPVSQFGSHYIDLVHYITGAEHPTSCVCNGGIFTWIDENKFSVPDHVEALWVYPQGFMVTFSCNTGQSGGSRHRYFCEKGQLNLDNWSAPNYTAEGGPKRDGSIRGVNEVKAIETPDHFQDWLQCMRSGKTTRAPIEAGYRHAVACLMGVESFKTGHRMLFNAEKRKIYAG
ncbi:MAG: Gfo/Idh/MocA family oxidoreductase [Kiritimatiellae bacterium]|nr:Gfo/Idh/MocA family oxidoreductase [Kiritimatiellia bacterium]MDD5519308.1 Gfo/Idh/MocA family oxidoreductase [Kiritimatiellia bacterium]